MTTTPRADALRPYIDRGFSEIPTDSGTGSRILINDKLGRVVKLNEDRAYHTFAEHAKSNSCEHLPQVFSHTVHERIDQLNGYWFTLTEMERLETLSKEEAGKIIAWYTAVIAEDTPKSAIDPFDLQPIFQTLIELARSSRHNLDMGKATNYMIREHDGERIFVITDPYN